LNGGSICFSQNQINHTDLIDSQLSFSNFILSRCNSDNYSSDSLLIALNRNKLVYGQFRKYFEPKTDPKFFKNITYSYDRISFLFDEKKEVVYWMDKYNIYLRGLKNRFTNKNNNWIASSKRTKYVSNEKEPKEEDKAILLKQQRENQQIADSFEEAELLVYLEAQKLAEETEAKILAYQQERQRIVDSLAKAEQLAEFESQRLAEETAAKILAFQKESQRIVDSLAKAEQLAEFESQRLAEETEAKLLTDQLESKRTADSVAEAEQLTEFEQQRKAEEARLLAEQLKNKRIADSTAEAEQLAEFEQQRKAEEARLLAEQTENKRIVDSIAEAEQLAELEQQRKAEEARLLAEQVKNKRISDSIAEAKQLAELEQQRKVEEARLLAEQVKNKRISDSIAEAKQLAELEQQRKAEEARLLKEQGFVQRQSNQILDQPQSINDVTFSEMYTAPKVEFSEYYTIKLTTVYSPMEGISFLNNVRDGDEIWKENAFHLYQDEYNSDLTNISIGKFSSLDDADIVINKLKNKGLTNAKAIKYTNKMKSNLAASNKSVSNTSTKKAVVNPARKTVVNNTTEPSTNISKENQGIKTSTATSKNIKTSRPKIEEVKTYDKSYGNTDNALKNISKEVSKDQDFFTVQLAAVSEITSDRINTINLDKKQLFYQNINAGNYALNYKKFSNYGAAHTKAIELHGKGFEGAYVTKYVNNKRITVTKADLLNDNVSESTIEADLRTLGYKPLDFNRKGKYIQIGSFYNWDSHSYQDSYEFINHSIYFMVNQSNIVKFLIGPFSERDLFIELRNVKKQINDAFIKTI